MLHTFASAARKPLFPSIDNSVSVRPARVSNVRSVSMSLPRYHHVEMPMPAPNVPSTEFSCQKHPLSLTTALVNIDDPTASVISASVTPLQSAPWKPPPGAAGPGAGDVSDGPQAVSHATAAAKPTKYLTARQRWAT